MRELIEKYFHIQPSLAITEVAARLRLVCEAVLEINEISAEERSELSRIYEYLCSYKEAEITNFRRTEFHGELESHPLSVTMMLIPAFGENHANFHQFKLLCAMLARLYLSRGTDDYEAYLQFYKTFIRNNDAQLPFGANFVTRASIYEVQVELRKVALNRNNTELEKLSRYYQPSREPTSKNAHSDGFNAAAKYLRQRLQLDGDINADLVDALNKNGEHLASVLHITPELTKLTSQEYSIFQKKITGIQRALYNAEVAPAWTLSAATPCELTALLNHIDKNLILEKFSQIDAKTSAYLFIFFLKILGVPRPLELMLINRGSPKFSASMIQAGSIDYLLKKRVKNELEDARLTLNARLIDIEGPKEESRRFHYYTSELITIRLPEPLISLLQNSLSNIDATRRHECEISYAFGIEENDSNAWINAQIKSAGFAKFGITRSSFEKVFLQYAREAIPEATLNLLQQQGSVQQHYLLQSHREIAKQINQAWGSFIATVGFTRVTRVDAVSHSEHLAHAGSEMTLRSSLLDEILMHSVNSASQHLKTEAFHAFNELAFYIYLRVSMTVGLRPVAEPFPNHEFYSSKLGVMSVKDKAVHHKKERRLIVLTSKLCELIDAHIAVAEGLASILAISTPIHIVSRITDNKKWESFSSAFVNDKLTQLLTAKVTSHSLRHVAAQSFLRSSITQGQFLQSALNLFLNHSRSNAYALSNHSLLSITDFITSQRKQLEVYDAHHHENDAKALQLLELLRKEFKL
ncbi:hypothetical protein [Pseudidiomarina donghaiensis]|uniref:Uncharacterized protein n=1 Tax=Pseudidiomarina donghaiensis TaxID=519452 RepID=A0A432XK14_9GAMM|nr:hypothetical protein [Pseudidiomarina donghaiensis]RUO48962.1 hypothetical protein CWE24_00125 [Pseudidiomarina donghaiensis]SFV20319.1 hypothetical protein SAMN04488139_0157 [Pseudidiomarina donghaiensis]